MKKIIPYVLIVAGGLVAVIGLLNLFTLPGADSTEEPQPGPVKEPTDTQPG